ncbi:hypothetical protein [Actinomadura sp. DC4]|uniref:hypothetical protein n=1 Tax=Actinomadura sp. DC4 TaxID=3055069 RepID=UPI0025B108A2|nr:hypothetical protein [Actinomadura sp. DC4]MDN3357277.1 hypothetical protein [Actinomadura sp. DC4]
MPDSLADYDSVQTFIVSPRDILVHARNIESDSQVIADSLGVIVDALQSLNLGWAGKTAQEANDFGDRWTAVAKELFGTDDHPEDGALNIVLDGVYIVASLFAGAEQGLKDFFTDMTTALAGDGGGDSGHPASITDVTTTAVTETW